MIWFLVCRSSLSDYDGCVLFLRCVGAKVIVCIGAKSPTFPSHLGPFCSAVGIFVIYSMSPSISFSCFPVRSYVLLEIEAMRDSCAPLSKTGLPWIILLSNIIAYAV